MRAILAQPASLYFSLESYIEANTWEIMCRLHAYTMQVIVVVALGTQAIEGVRRSAAPSSSSSGQAHGDQLRARDALLSS